MHFHSDDLLSTSVGCVLSITLHVVGAINLPQLGTEMVSSLAVGVMGGIGGYLGKQLIEKLLKKRNNK